MRGGPITAGRRVSTWHALRQCMTSSREGGFTVIEVVIVLAISGGLFVSAVLMISGRQNQTAFDQSIRQIQSQIQQVLNEVSTGYYPTNSDFRCAAGAAGQPPILTSASSAQGTNSGCIFLGKAIQFRVASTDPEQFVVYTVAGLKQTSSGTESATLADARPVVVAPATLSQVTSGYPDNSSTEQLQNGLTTVRAWYRNGGADVEIGSIVFVNSLADYGGSSNLVSGSGRVNIVAVDNTALNSTKVDLVQALNSDGGNRLVGGTINPVGGVFICFESAGTQDYAIVQIGGESRDLAVTLTVKDKTGSTCTFP